jgi:hypothetical protein
MTEGIVVGKDGPRIVEGTLTVVAKTGGLKLNIKGVETNWINPTETAKKLALERMSELKGIVGKTVLLELNAQDLWNKLEVADETGEGFEEDEPIPFEETATSAPGKSESRKNDTFLSPTSPTADANSLYARLKGVTGASKKFKVGDRNLTYLSWAEAWGKLKEYAPTANYQVHENASGLPYFYDQTGGMVKVTVTIEGLSHTVHLPIMDHRNQSILLANIRTTDINKSIQRALTKAIAMHGLGLYIYQGEDFPSKEE